MTPTSRATFLAVVLACATPAARPNVATANSACPHAHALTPVAVTAAIGPESPGTVATTAFADASMPAKLIVSILSLGGLGLYLRWRTRRHG